MEVKGIFQALPASTTETSARYLLYKERDGSREGMDSVKQRKSGFPSFCHLYRQSIAE
jgi:hypothetical protein